MKEAPRFLILDDTRLINLEQILSIELLPQEQNEEYQYLREDQQTPDFVLAICLGYENYHYLADDAAANFLMKSRVIFGSKYPSAFGDLINTYKQEIIDTIPF
jgi:hypothetical protein